MPSKKKSVEVAEGNRKDKYIAAVMEKAQPLVDKVENPSWDLVRERLAALEKANEPIITAINKHARTPLSGSRQMAASAAFELCRFFAKECIDGKDLSKELDMCCTLASEIYSHYPD